MFDKSNKIVEYKKYLSDNDYTSLLLIKANIVATYDNIFRNSKLPSEVLNPVSTAFSNLILVINLVLESRKNIEVNIGDYNFILNNFKTKIKLPTGFYKDILIDYIKYSNDKEVSIAVKKILNRGAKANRDLIYCMDLIYTFEFYLFDVFMNPNISVDLIEHAMNLFKNNYTGSDFITDKKILMSGIKSLLRMNYNISRKLCRLSNSFLITKDTEFQYYIHSELLDSVISDRGVIDYFYGRCYEYIIFDDDSVRISRDALSRTLKSRSYIAPKKGIVINVLEDKLNKTIKIRRCLIKELYTVNNHYLVLIIQGFVKGKFFSIPATIDVGRGFIYCSSRKAVINALPFILSAYDIRENHLNILLASNNDFEVLGNSYWDTDISKESSTKRGRRVYKKQAIEVSPCIKRLAEGQKASQSRILLAKKYNIKLNDGETLVDGHIRHYGGCTTEEVISNKNMTILDKINLFN